MTWQDPMGLPNVDRQPVDSEPAGYSICGQAAEEGSSDRYTNTKRWQHQEERKAQEIPRADQRAREMWMAIMASMVIKTLGAVSPKLGECFQLIPGTI